MIHICSTYPFINYIFENKRIFDLILFQSAGTKYQDIVEKITDNHYHLEGESYVRSEKA
ncbi:hypothetical protein EfmAA610_29410 [Enterococcus faecium]|nr:hypothetical protein EfmAA610_29410 [Enterococcus faecium]